MTFRLSKWSKYMYRGMPNMTAPYQSNRDWYDWDALIQSCTDMTETPKKFFSRISILHTWDCDTLKSNDQKNLGRLSHIYTRLDQDVSVILVQILVQASH